MDKTKEYVNQCKKAKELQKEHKPQHDDYYYYEDFRGLFVKSIDERDKEVMRTAESSVWIPTQDQLQEIRYPDNHKLRTKTKPWYIVEGLLLFLERYGYLHKSMEQLWLAFVMSELYKKRWSGKDWVRYGMAERGKGNMKLKDLGILPKKKPYHEKNLRMSESENHGLRMWDSGYNKARQEDNGVEIEMDAEKILKIIKDFCGGRTPFLENKNSWLLAQSIAKALPSILRGKK